MKFSIITVCHNAVDNLAMTIESVIGQTYNDIEYIVIDGHSTDGTVDVIQEYASDIAYWESNPDNGIYDAMNKGIDKSHGDYILFLNAGDLFFNKSILDDIAAIINQKKCMPDVIYGETVGRNSKGFFPIKIHTQPFQEDMGCCHQSILVKGDIMRMEKFDTKYQFRADFDLLHRLYLNKKYDFCYIHRYISIYDYLGASSSLKHQRKMREEQLDIIGKKFSYANFIIWFMKYLVYYIKIEVLPLEIRHLYSSPIQIMSLSEIKQFND